MRSAALGLEKYGVNANAIAPVASTRMQANVPGGTAETGEPEDVAPMVVYLLSDAAREITGQTYTVVGGRIALWSQPREIQRDRQGRPLDSGGARRADPGRGRHRPAADARLHRHDEEARGRGGAAPTAS